MKVPLSWIREFVDVTAPADEIGKTMGVRGLPLESLETHGDDVVFDFEVTVNRPACMSVFATAREIATAYQLPLGQPEGSPRQGSLRANGRVAITIVDPELRGRYVWA